MEKWRGNSVELNFEPSAIVGELKLSNKELHVFNSYCEQKKDCAQFKLQSIMNVEQKKLLKHQVTGRSRSKKVHRPEKFGLKTRTELKNQNTTPKKNSISILQKTTQKTIFK